MLQDLRTCPPAPQIWGEPDLLPPRLAGLVRFPETRPELKFQANSPSRLKTTQILIYSPLSEDFSYETGVETPGGLETVVKVLNALRHQR